MAIYKYKYPTNSKPGSKLPSLYFCCKPSKSTLASLLLLPLMLLELSVLLMLLQ